MSGSKTGFPLYPLTFVVIGQTITVRKNSLAKLPLKMTTGRNPACSLPLTGFKFTFQISAYFMLRLYL